MPLHKGQSSGRQHIPNPNYHASSVTQALPTSVSPASQTPRLHAPFSEASYRSRDPLFPDAQTPRNGGSQVYPNGGPRTMTSNDERNGHPRPPSWGNSGQASSAAAASTSATSSTPPISSSNTTAWQQPHRLPYASHTPAHSHPSNGTAHMYGYGSAHRAPHGEGASPQSYHPGAPVEGPPPPPSLPPPSFGTRQMPPPSPPQGQQPPFGAPGPPPPPQFPGTRDLPGLRSGSGMSISSILGSSQSGAATPRRSPPPGNASSPTNSSMRPPSPRATPYNAGRPDYSHWRRPQTPEHASSKNGLRVEHRPYGARSPVFGPSSTLPDLVQPSASLHRYTSSHPTVPTTDVHSSQSWRRDGAPPRPNSQPTTAHGLPPPPLAHEFGDPARHRAAYYGTSGPEQRRADEEQHRVRSISDPRTGESERPNTVQPVAAAAYSPPAAQRYHSSQYGLGGYPSRGPENGPRENGTVHEERAGYATYGPPPSAYGPGSQPSGAVSTSTHDGVVGNGDGRGYRGSPEQPFRGASEPFPGRSLGQLNGPDRRSEAYSGSASEVPPRSHPYDTSAARMGEELQHQRLQLNISPETFRRQLGRASPLPQAVQGAQAQMKGPGGDPNIKSEFGRMFSGLGSGYGGGSVTPSRGSPMPQARPDGAELGSGELDSLQMVRSGSRGMKGRRRFKEEDGRADSEYGDRSSTPSGTKRAKHSHTPAAAAHHHHPHIVHHHHHKPEDDLGVPQARSVTPTTFANRLNSSANSALGPQPLGATPHHHHHYPPHHHNHVHGHVHYHHGAGSGKQQTPVPVAPPMQRRKTIIKSQAVMQSVVDRPRSHLGSQLYRVKYDLPPRSCSITVLSNVPGPLGISDRFGYTMRPLPIPKFDPSKVNCTFTIRVPRLYLTPEKREEICRHRFLWGSEIYSDDSDPVAAAIHSGWIQGEWTREIDAELLELSKGGSSNSSGERRNGAQSLKATEIPQAMTTPLPAGPVIPPQNIDCHITVIILPQLASYAPTTRNGIKSRAWGEGHDGLSFMVHKVEWVDEGAFGGSAMEERGGAARRRRLKLLASQRGRVADVIARGEGKRNGSGATRRRGRVEAVGAAVVEAVG